MPDCLVRLRRLTAVDNGSSMFGCPLAVRDSHLEGDDFYDFLTPLPPRLVRTACERSQGGVRRWQLGRVHRRLILHRHRRAVAQHGAMHLRQRRGGKRRLVQTYARDAPS